MTEKIPIDIGTIKFKSDVFPMKALYQFVREWLDEEGFTQQSNSIPENYMEIFYSEALTQNGMKEHWVWWRPFKILNSYFKYDFSIDFHTLGLKDVEIMHQGKKIKMNKGEVEIFFTPKLVLDHTGSWEKWKKSPTLSYFEKLFRTRIYKTEIKRQEEELRSIVYRLHQSIQRFLGEKAYLRDEVLFKSTKDLLDN